MRVYRKVTNEDLFGKSTTVAKFKHVGKVIIRKNQTEYGAKKFIKPWRTGTKSQQIPPQSGFNKNLR